MPPALSPAYSIWAWRNTSWPPRFGASWPSVWCEDYARSAKSADRRRQRSKRDWETVYPPDTRSRRATGCQKCNRIGYRGQIGVYELLATTPEIERMIMARHNASELREQAIKQGMLTLRQDGLAKVREGITTPSEVLRVTQD